jgi:hypothetical protein
MGRVFARRVELATVASRPQRPREAQLMAVGVGQMKTALAPFGVGIPSRLFSAA